MGGPIVVARHGKIGLEKKLQITATSGKSSYRISGGRALVR